MRKYRIKHSRSGQYIVSERNIISYILWSLFFLIPVTIFFLLDINLFLAKTLIALYVLGFIFVTVATVLILIHTGQIIVAPWLYVKHFDELDSAVEYIEELKSRDEEVYYLN